MKRKTDYKSSPRLTLSELRSCKEYENISDADGEELIDFLFQLSLLCYRDLTKADVKLELQEYLAKNTPENQNNKSNKNESTN